MTHPVQPEPVSCAAAACHVLRRVVRFGHVVPMIVGLAAGAALAGSPGSVDDDPDRTARLAEYEGLLVETLPLADALCMDGLLGARWPRVADPSPAQWEGMLEQAGNAREQCASAAGGTERGVAAIRRGMARQVARQKALEAHRARLRACAAALPPDPPAPGCGAQDIGDIVTAGQWMRIVRATLLGRRK